MTLALPTNRAGVTLTEILIAAGILSLFMAGLFTLYSGGQTASATAFWLQKTATGLRDTTRHVSDRVQKTSYPSTLVYPAKIIENTSADFSLRVNQGGRINAADCLAVTGKTTVATKILWFTESFPERLGFETELTASLTYHIYSLSKGGQLLYHRFQETLAHTSPPDYIRAVARPTIPPAGATQVESQELVTDVEFVNVGIQSATATGTPVSLEIGCLNPRGRTRRADQLTVIPNVAAVTAAP